MIWVNKKKKDKYQPVYQLSKKKEGIPIFTIGGVSSLSALANFRLRKRCVQ